MVKSTSESNKDTRDAETNASGQLVGKGSIYTIATALQLVGAILVLPALSRLLPREEYGQVALAIVVTNLLGLVATLGLPAVITREYFLPNGELQSRRLAALTMVTSTVLVGLFVVSGPLWAKPFGGFQIALAIGTVTSASWAVIVTAQSVLRAANQAKRFVTLSVIYVLGGQLLGLSAAWTVSNSAVNYLIGVFAGSILAALIGIAWIKPTFAGWREQSQLRSWLGIALPTVPHTAALFLMATGDRFIIDIQRGDEGVAAYALAYQVGAFGISVVAAANNAWAPLIYGAGNEKRWSTLATTTKDMLRLAALLAALLAFTAPLALWILADPAKYDIDSLIPLVALTALAAVPYTLYLASAHVLFWRGKTTQLLWITPLAVVINLAAKALVVPEWGFTGAAIVTVAAYTLLALLVGAVRSRLATVPWTARALTCLLAAAACVGGAILPTTVAGHIIRLGLTVAALVATFLTIRDILATKANKKLEPVKS